MYISVIKVVGLCSAPEVMISCRQLVARMFYVFDKNANGTQHNARNNAIFMYENGIGLLLNNLIDGRMSC